jgi:hypothetical protein
MPRYRGATNAEAARKVSEIAQIAEQWLQLHQDPPKRAASTVSTGIPIRRGEAKSRRDSVRCEYCSGRFSSATQREEHVLESHVAGDSDKTPVGLAKPLVRIGGKLFERRTIQLAATPTFAHSPTVIKSVRRMIKCRKCHSDVRSDRMDRHLHERCPPRHGAIPTKESSPSAAPKSRARMDSTTRRLTGDVISGGSTKPLHLGRHGSKRLNPVAEHDSNSDPRKEYREERRLDGSKDFWPHRDQGRFGSHPSFDACDDESIP